MSASTPAQTWSATLGQLQLQVTPANYETWLRDTIGLRHDDGVFVVGVHSDFAIEWLNARMRPLIVKTLARVLGHQVEVAFERVREDGRDEPVLLSPPPAPEDAAAPAARGRVAPPAVHPALTFDAFVVGDENRLAYKAARNAIVQPGSMNPLVIVGGAGLGKTHLLSAIAHEAFEQGLAAVYATAERFGNDYVKAREAGYESLRRKYRTCDVLLVDDVQFLEGKEQFQREFFHTFNDLHAAGKQIVVACDRMPSELQLIDALRSRLQWGLTADLQKPAYETRLAILRAKLRHLAQQLPERALERIARICCPTVRELEGYLNRVLAYLPMVASGPTDEAIDEALSPFRAAPAGQQAPPTAEAVLEAVTRCTGIPLADLAGRARTRDITYARHLAMYLLREDARKSVAEVGRLLGHRDHSTVLSGISRITGELAVRAETRADVAAGRATMAETAASGDLGAAHGPPPSGAATDQATRSAARSAAARRAQG